MRTTVIAASGMALAVALLPGIAAAPQEKPGRGARVAVVAFHDSRLLTLCPVIGKQADRVGCVDAEDGGESHGLLCADQPAVHRPPFRAARTRPGVLADARVGLHVTDFGRASASGGRELDRLARDVGVERRLAAQFSAHGTYVVVDSPAAADFVFVAESTYIPMSIGTGDPPPDRPAEQRGRDSAARIFSDTEAEWNRRIEWRESVLGAPAPPPPAPPPPNPLVLGFIGGDRPLNWRQSILALVVPAASYLEHAGDGGALAAASVWSGLSAADWGPRSRDARTLGAATPETLVDRFHSKGTGLPDYLPVCAATAGTIRAISDPPESVPAQPAQAAPAPPPQPPSPRRASGRPRFTSAVTLVTVPVTVTSREGEPLRDLPPSAFRVFEDDVEQKVERVDHGTAPADVVLLIDTSASMRAVRDRIRTSASDVAGASRAADRAMIVTFDSRVRVVSEFTKDASALQRALAQTPPGGGTRLYDALALVAVDRLGQIDGRKAVVLLTDGSDTRSQLSDGAGALAALRDLQHRRVRGQV